MPLAADCCGYVAWVHRSFETLISLLRATNQKVEADERHASMLDWLQRNPPQVTVSWSQLLEGTPAPAPEFWADAGGRTAPPPLIKHLAVRRGAVVMTLWWWADDRPMTGQRHIDNRLMHWRPVENMPKTRRWHWWHTNNRQMTHWRQTVDRPMTDWWQANDRLMTCRRHTDDRPTHW